ncbi:probable RNA-directed DNA polymerase from transposon X-element [Trichonephila clavipes]|nr:probable RNA-directed DNA polymerase from transposon X-element [Trichonephila clavipes]
MLDVLWHRVEAAWASVPVHAIQSLFNSMQRRINAVITARGGCSGDHNTDELIRERDAARHELEKNNSDENRRNLIDINHKVEDEIATYVQPILEYWQTTHYLENVSVTVLVLKPNKDIVSCKNFRSISLTSTLYKIMEKTIPSRIMNWLIKRKVLHFYQTAYRAQHSTVDQLFYLVQSIIDEIQEKLHRETTVLFLDLSAAFDRVWRQKLIEILHFLGISGNILLWINDLQRDRRFAVRVNGKFSRKHRSWAGVPQESVLSPLLFLLCAPI